MGTGNDASKADPVCLDFKSLTDPSIDLAAEFQKAFGPDGLGLITVKNVPDFPTLRRNLLPLAARLAQLPDEVKLAYEDPASTYNFGWSCGKETLENGAPDYRKGSFYANPLCDRPSEDPSEIAAEPAYCRPNIWPKELPELEGAFKALGKVIYDVGILLTAHCNKLLEERGSKVTPSLTDVLARSKCHKASTSFDGRLLCYLPPNSAAPSDGGAEQWCGWHNDHGSLTGLTSAMYTDAHGNEIGCKDPAAGLYAKNRNGDMVRVVIPPDHIAFQLGEAFQILSGGVLQATPHCVVAPRAEYQEGLHRNTMALFMQPKWDEVLKCPTPFDPSNVEVDAWKPGVTFGEFSKARFKNYYSDRGGAAGGAGSSAAEAS